VPDSDARLKVMKTNRKKESRSTIAAAHQKIVTLED
jgi:hypothetical protein